MSTMEQALRDEIAEHKRCIASYERDKTYIQSSAIRWHRARLAALTAALPAPGVEAPGDWVMVPRVATDAMTEAAKEYLDATDLEIGMAYDLMIAAAPSAPAEISQAQAQAQAMREAVLEEAAKVVEAEPVPNAEYSPTIVCRRDLRMAAAIRCLAALTPEPPR